MQEDFHYYATYCAAFLAGYSHKESHDIAYSAQFVDLCSATLLTKIHAPVKAATTMLQLEMMDGGLISSGYSISRESGHPSTSFRVTFTRRKADAPSGT